MEIINTWYLLQGLKFLKRPNLTKKKQSLWSFHISKIINGTAQWLPIISQKMSNSSPSNLCMSTNYFPYKPFQDNIFVK